MGDQPQPPKDTKPPIEPIAPPKDLPDFFKQERVGPVVPPLPPQLHPFPSPKIVVAPPTPCPLTSPSEMPSHSQFVIPDVAEEKPAVTTGKSGVSSSAKNAEPSKNASQQSKTFTVGMPEAAGQQEKPEGNDEETGVLGWLQKRVNNSSFLSKVADKAKTSMDSVLTTLDPGMKDFLKRGENLDIVIASDNARIITAIVEGFNRIFTSVNYRGVGTPGAGHLQAQIIGHSQALKYMNERITLLRASGLASPKSAVVVFQPFLHEIEGEWYESAVIGAQKNTAILHVFTQPVQVESTVVIALKNHTPKDYAPNAFATTVGSAYAEVYAVDPDDWQLARYSISSSESYRIAAAMVAHSFKEKYSRP